MFLYLFAIKSTFEEITNGDYDYLHEKAKSLNTYIYFYSRNSDNKNEFIQNLLKSEFENVHIATMKITNVNKIYNDLSSELPILTKVFPDRINDFKLRTTARKEDDIQQFISQTTKDISINLFGNFKSIIGLNIEGGSSFHLRANKGSPMIQLYKKISKIYYNDIYKMTFAYTENTKKSKPALTVYYSKHCVRVFKGNDMDLNEIIFQNRFSHFHHFEREEFLDVVNKTNGMVFLIPSDHLSSNEIYKMEQSSKLMCGKFVMGWSRRDVTQLGHDFRVHNDQNSEVAIVNRETDCLFIVNMNAEMHNFKYYVKDALTNTNCWRYPEDSTKVVKIHYRKTAILLSILTSIIFAVFAYSTTRSSE
ncbi:hypothetical protein TVAG_456950 [Trichomonas vaginalis G3]|uniref:Uncharacterized protein n=1 Tax=Trichomonas vaginalis (strain ATCC PRA-98 / G3) TaxID=412133 RepID=A2DC19_TRIV3|nr:hypothetical protein TVAGG3_0263700 [Trichomonas vaginalis G3]EAY22060.1 hypothetical protein TVAG_456950 [Trichomonas vaginalis G3]KAI5525312.1 hypothetical protein TVAGG3_0263700 [Trichomonas vaginalis G3]|eukprot:XP_001583046.1 hypothetical protein [Trichomonas vaginalis G3]